MFHAAILLVITTLLWFLLDTLKPRNYPPGPKWYPIVGSIPQLAKLRKKHGLFSNAVAELNATYGKKGIIGLKVGKDKLVITFSYETSKELCFNEDLDGRPTGPFYETRTWGTRKGIIFTDGEFWREQRNFVSRHLKDFGFARQGMSERVQYEAQYLLEDIQKLVKEQGGRTAQIPVHDLFGVNVLNALWTMMAGVRYERNNAELEELRQLFYDLYKNIDMVGCMFSHFPILRYIAPESSGYNCFLELHEKMYKFLGRELQRHKNALHPSDEPRDLMDSYLQAINEQNSETNFSERQLMAICLDMFLAGSDTTTKSLGFAVLYLTLDERIQRRMQDEMDVAIGRGRLPTWKDRESMPYCEAVVNETIRIFAGPSFSVPHRALRDTKIGGYNIPKDTMVISCFTGMLMDEHHFTDPYSFRPERFIQNGKCIVPEAFAPFGAKHRRCMGENMAKQTVFLFLTTLIQSYMFRIPKGHPMPDKTPDDGATISVKPFVVELVAR